jgi:hypothetical protein
MAQPALVGSGWDAFVLAREASRPPGLCKATSTHRAKKQAPFVLQMAQQVSVKTRRLWVWRFVCAVSHRWTQIQYRNFLRNIDAFAVKRTSRMRPQRYATQSSTPADYQLSIDSYLQQEDQKET